MSSIKSVTTEKLRDLNRVSLLFGYNRNITSEGIAALDADGRHVLRVALVHEHAAGELVEPHYRLLVLMKLRGKKEPVPVTLDIPIGLWRQLPEVSL